MKRGRKRTISRLITGCLEGISKRVFADYAAQIAELAGEEPGIYALYHKGKLYYVGLATDLRRRIKHHLEDKHARHWDTFSLYVVRKEAHLRDLEAMTIRIGTGYDVHRLVDGRKLIIGGLDIPFEKGSTLRSATRCRRSPPGPRSPAR